MSAPVNPTSDHDGVKGSLYALTAFSMWGVFPLYFKLVADVPALEILAHRIVWSVFFVMVLLTLWRGWKNVATVAFNGQNLCALALSAALVSLNWGVFIWAVNNGFLLQVSIGYYINPLVNVVLGVVFLQERLSNLGWFAVALAVAAVLNMIFFLGEFPWISLTVAISFGFYGLVRKKVNIDALPGLFVETGLILPIALGYLLYLAWIGQAAFLNPQVDLDLTLMASGVITASPLIFFAAAARKLNLSTLGFFQYIAPTGHFLLAVFYYGDEFTGLHLVTFALIWAGVFVFSFDAAKRHRNNYLPRANE